MSSCCLLKLNCFQYNFNLISYNLFRYHLIGKYTLIYAFSFTRLNIPIYLDHWNQFDKTVSRFAISTLAFGKINGDPILCEFHFCFSHPSTFCSLFSHAHEIDLILGHSIWGNPVDFKTFLCLKIVYVWKLYIPHNSSSISPFYFRITPFLLLLFFSISALKSLISIVIQSSVCLS